MRTISGVDRIIAAGLVILLLALLAVAVADRGNSPRADSIAGRSADSSAGHLSATRSSGSSTPVPAPPAAATATSSAATPTTVPGAPLPVSGPVSAVGDSILLDIQPYLEADIPGARVDGVVSRQFDTGVGVVQADRAEGDLGTVLVVELGTNGTVTSSDFDAMMQASSGVRRVVFVNVDVPRPWEAEDNAVLAAGVARYPGVAVLADWYTLSSVHPEWFTPDQVHLEPAGAQALADLVAGYA